MNQFPLNRGPASMWRRASACLLAALIVVLGVAAPASAHGGVTLTLHGDGRGSVWVTMVWQDSHPVTEAIGMTLLATGAGGQRVGPVALKRTGEAVTYSGALAVGDWNVVVDMGTPAIGRCEGTLHVALDGAPQDIVCAPPPVASSPTPATEQTSQSFTWMWYLLSFAALAAAAGWFFYRRR